MTDTDDDRRHDIALFRYGVIAELVQWPEGAKGLYARLKRRRARDYAIPGSSRTRVAEETIRDWLKAYRQGGFEALLPKPRADRGQVRKLPAAVAEALLATKEANPALSVQLVIREARTARGARGSAAAALDRAPAAGPPWADGQARRRGRRSATGAASPSPRRASCG
jgi:putative transposase